MVFIAPMALNINYVNCLAELEVVLMFAALGYKEEELDTETLN